MSKRLIARWLIVALASLLGACVQESLSPPACVPHTCESLGIEYDHVIALSGTNTATSVTAMINALSAGSVLIRTADGEGSPATIDGNLIVPRADVVFDNVRYFSQI